MRKICLLKSCFLVLALFSLGLLFDSPVLAQPVPSTSKEDSRLHPQTSEDILAATASADATESAEATTPGELKEIVKPPKESIGEFEQALRDQKLGSVWLNPIKYAIRNSVKAGISIETIILLLLLPIVASVIAGARNLIGLRGFGILLPAALAVVFLGTGPVVGIGLFLVIVFVTTLIRMILRKLKFRLQYLPRMALILWAVVLGVLAVLFAAPYVPQLDIFEVSILPILILILLSEDFMRAQLGKSIGVAVALTTETLVLALISFAVLSLRPIQYLALLNPEQVLIATAIIDFFLGRYVGLRFLEIWRFRRLIKS